MKRAIEYVPGDSLLQILRNQQIHIESSCNGNGTCGKCKVKILNGYLESLTETEKKLLKSKEIEAGIRLACLIIPRENLEIELPNQEEICEVLSSGYMPEFEHCPYGNGYGICVDIGTTTVVCELVDKRNGQQLAQSTMINPQKKYGLDVLTRIAYEYEYQQQGIQELQSAIIKGINECIQELCQRANIKCTSIEEVVVAANCTMLHMLLGIDARSIGKAPYEPQFLEAQERNAKELGISVKNSARVYCIPSVSAFIGADIVAGTYVCELEKQDKNVLFIDIGTNGEIILSNGGHLLCCSCAAGPALEGMNISCGMRAAQGAIEDILITKGSLELKTIDNQPPVGICGSGVLAAVRELLRVGLIRKEGAFIKKEKMPKEDYRQAWVRENGKKREFVLQNYPEIIITQSDVRQVQLAKGAILSGFKALLKRANIDIKHLDKIMIAGQFGAYLSVDSLIGVGILPMEVKDKIIYVGNTSKTGAYMALMSESIKRDMERLAKEITYMELAQTSDYEKLFAESLMFPSSDGSGKSLNESNEI